jgi:hypothetical protein
MGEPSPGSALVFSLEVCCAFLVLVFFSPGCAWRSFFHQLSISLLSLCYAVHGLQWLIVLDWALSAFWYIAEKSTLAEFHLSVSFCHGWWRTDEMEGRRVVSDSHRFMALKSQMTCKHSC